MANGADLSLRYRGERFEGEATVFINVIDKFIFPFQTGEVEEDLPVVNFISADSKLTGFEAHLDAGPHQVALARPWRRRRARGAARRRGPAPAHPPYRLWAGLRFEHKGFHLEGEVKTVGEQTRVYGAETPTDGYTIVNAHGSYQLTSGRAVHTFTLRADNIGDELYRNHLSYIKDLTPEMGQSFKLVYGVRF